MYRCQQNKGVDYSLFPQKPRRKNAQEYRAPPCVSAAANRPALAPTNKTANKPKRSPHRARRKLKQNPRGINQSKARAIPQK